MTEMLQYLETVIQERRANPSPESYTASLFAAGENRIAQKLGEEAIEVIVAALGQDRSAQVDEFADLFYHALVLMARLDISLADVCAELERRHRAQ